MSLFDALVIQEYIQPPAQADGPIRREVFVAIRNDRPFVLPDIVFYGSGTENHDWSKC